ncbi:MAG TPA: helix-turn-helix domain-containing protein [Candidatus Limnocylindria bacterium]|nr:helix-turn-helix domain-containing protein [Candidatus Limnocylindria bacterium]
MVTNERSDRPWAAIDPSIASALRPTLPALVEDTLEHIDQVLPSMGKDLAGPYGVDLRRGIVRALERFLNLLGQEVDALDPALTELYGSFGAREDHHGRSLETLLTAYRVGARGAWVHFSGAAVAERVPTDQVIRLAEAIFAYVDELSAASALGFARAQVRRAGHRDLARRQLAQAILDGEAATSAPRVNDLAGDAGWPLPDRLAVAIWRPPGDVEASSEPAVPHPEVLFASSEDEVRALVPDFLLRDRRGRARLGPPGVTVSVGTVRPPAEAPISLAHARAIATLVDEGVLDGDGLVAAAEHLATLVVHADRRLLADLRGQVLAPLEQVAAARRPVMAATLCSWLAHHGDRVATSSDLGVHPQTVSYRMAELRRLFGAALEDPHARFALLLALQDPSG